MRFAVLTLIPVLALGLTAARAASLPDTGQDKCYDGAAMVTCTIANTGDAAAYPRQDGRFGRDAKATTGTLGKIGGGAAGFDYSKIANNGSDLGAGVGLPLGNNPSEWACTRDNITGLVWEVKVNDSANPRHMNWIYTWYNSDGTTNGGNAGTPDTGGRTADCLTALRCDTQKFVADVNAGALCSYTDWRLPTQRELLTLVHRGMQGPSIDTAYFPNTTAAPFWTGSPFVRITASAWGVDFGGGFSGPDDKANRVLVRLVRGPQF